MIYNRYCGANILSMCSKKNYYMAPLSGNGSASESGK